MTTLAHFVVGTHIREGKRSEAVAVEFNYLIVPQNCCNNCSKQLQTRREKRSHAGKCRQRLNLSRKIRPNCAWNSPRESEETERESNTSSWWVAVYWFCCMHACALLCVQRQKQKHRNTVTRIALFVFVRVFRIAKVEERSSSNEPSKSRYERWAQREWKRERVKQQSKVVQTPN